jgi:hypothetical protein
MGPYSEERQRERAAAVQRLLDDPTISKDARRIWTNVQRGLSRSEAQYNARVVNLYTQMRNRYTREWMV